ncbi:MAG TPA: hypothetical protein VNC50_15070, partial [Planctomycetia bacterium]|nr:hypothetical protein [Planctomycetia bacterium]
MISRFTFGIFAAAALGCGGADPAQRFVPADELARAAIHEALASWKDGRAPDKAGADGPPVKVADAAQKTLPRPTGFKIIGEVAGPRPRTYAVRLQFAEAPTERTVKYLVVGVDPLWVFHE